MRINFWARRRPARSSWGRRSNKMFWQLSRGQGRALSSQLQISNGDSSSILISGTLGALIITESRSYKPSGIPSNRWLVSPRLYITGLRVHDVRPVRRVLRLLRRGFTLSSDVAVRSRFSDRYDHHDFWGFFSQWFADSPRILAKIFGGFVNLYVYFFETSLQTINVWVFN